MIFFSKKTFFSLKQKYLVLLINTNKAIEAKVDCLILPIFSDHKLRGAAKTINTANNKIISDFQRNKFFFENKVNKHRKFGAVVDSSFLELPELNKYVCAYELYGSNIATSSMFYITDISNNFVSGFLEFRTSINPEIEVQNNIMKQEVLKFINSFRWSSIPK